jgi:hypothetical protein
MTVTISSTVGGAGRVAHRRAGRAGRLELAAEFRELWGDEHDADALHSFAALLGGGAPERQAHQAPISHRVLPRVLGRLGEAQSHIERNGDKFADLRDR